MLEAKKKEDRGCRSGAVVAREGLCMQWGQRIQYWTEGGIHTREVMGGGCGGLGSVGYTDDELKI